MSKIIRLTENQFGEMMAYHGSNSDFDRFNHKKFLNSGVGSQSFGWGTYITNDKAIANSYARSSINIYKHMDEIPDVLSKKYGLTNDECYDVIENFYRFTNGFNIPVRDLDKEITKMDIAGYARREDMPYLDKYATIINYCRTTGERNNTLYEVDIPDDNGTNYLPWYESITMEQTFKIRDGIRFFEKRKGFSIINERTYNSIIYPENEPLKIKQIYYLLAESFGSQKAASLFLMYCGFDGIKYPAGTRWKKPDGAAEDAYNYVIFDASKVKIINKTRV